MRFIGLDVHRDFCEVAIAEGGEVRWAGRVQRSRRRWSCSRRASAATTRSRWRRPATRSGSRGSSSRTSAGGRRRPNGTGIRQAGAKTDKIDARTLARLLRRGRSRRGVAAGRADAGAATADLGARALVRQRTRAKNQVHATLIRNLTGARR